MKEYNDEKVVVIPFLKCFSGLVGAFPPEEVIFMMYMADRTRLREKGYDTLRSKRYHMESMEIGSRLFDKRVRKATCMGLLKRVPLSGMYDYFWVLHASDRLGRILAELKTSLCAKAFCRQVFDVEKRTVMSVSDKEVYRWKENGQKHGTCPP